MYTIIRSSLVTVVLGLLVNGAISGIVSAQDCENISFPLISCPSECFSSYGISDGGWFYDMMDSQGDQQEITSGGSCGQTGTTHIVQQSIDCVANDGSQRIRVEACHCWECP
jgi:hypothetical protein